LVIPFLSRFKLVNLYKNKVLKGLKKIK